MKARHVFLLLSLVTSVYLRAQSEDALFDALDKEIDRYSQNDARAMPLVNTYIRQSKKIKDLPHLIIGYENGVYLSPDREKKRIYADSALTASWKTGDSVLISRALLGVGIVYHCNFDDVTKALDYYLQAYRFSRNNDYQAYKIKYCIGVVKSYMGYNAEATLHFESCRLYFEKRLKNARHDNARYNYTRGLVNTLFRLITISRKTRHHDLAELYTKRARQLVSQRTDMEEDHIDVMKAWAMMSYYRKDYRGAIRELNRCLHEIGVGRYRYTYAEAVLGLGLSYRALGRQAEAMARFRQVDSMVSVDGLQIEALRPAFVFLRAYARKQGDCEGQLKYARILGDVDSLRLARFPLMSSRIHKEYDIKQEARERSGSRDTSYFDPWLLSSAAALVAAFLGCLLVIRRRLTRKHHLPKNKPEHCEDYKEQQPEEQRQQRKTLAGDKIRAQISTGLRQFEERKAYMSSKVTLGTLARELDTNPVYLSQFINTEKQMNFNSYLAQLRITQITQQLHEDPALLKYKIETLARSCGMTRKHFSAKFQAINGILPQEFIERLKQTGKKNEL